MNPNKMCSKIYITVDDGVEKSHVILKKGFLRLKRYNVAGWGDKTT